MLSGQTLLLMEALGRSQWVAPETIKVGGGLFVFRTTLLMRLTHSSR